MGKKVVTISMCANTAWSIFNFRKGLIENFLSKGIKVHVIAPDDAFSEKLRDLGCSVENLNIKAKGINPISDLIVLINLLKIYKRVKPNLAIHYTIKPNIYGSIAARLAGIDSIAITTGLGYTFTYENIISLISRGLYRFAFRFPREIWFLNDEDLSAFLSHKIVSSQNGKILHGEGVDVSFFKPLPQIKNQKKFTFVLISRMLKDKGIIDFASAARLIKKIEPECHFQLLGACDLPNPSTISRAQISEWEQEGIVEYLGAVDDVRPVIAAADCVVLPSYYREGVPRILMEAAAMAKPIITTDNVGCRDVVRDGVSGFVCAIKSPKQLSECCLKLIKMSPQECQEMGAKGRRLVLETFDEKIVISQYLDVVDRILGTTFSTDGQPGGNTAV